MLTAHANAPEAKAARRGAILSAAKALFIAGDGTLPTSAEIASAAGLAKGTVYIYFQTKEEIFAGLLLEGWTAVMVESQIIFQTTKGRRVAKVTAFLTSLVAHLERYPELLRLDALGYGILEKNMEREALRAHKDNFASRLITSGKIMDDSLQLSEGRGVQLLMRTYALTRGLWQFYQHAEETLRAGIEVSPILTPNAFGKELMEALTEYWHGALGRRATSLFLP